MKKIANIIHWVIFGLGVVGGLYVGGWLMFVQPIIDACKHFDAGTLTGLIVGTTILKCVFATTVSGIIIWVSSLIAAFVAAVVDANNNKSKSKRGK